MGLTIGPRLQFIFGSGVSGLHVREVRPGLPQDRKEEMMSGLFQRADRLKEEILGWGISLPRSLHHCPGTEGALQVQWK